MGSGMCRVCDAHSVAEPLACMILNALYGVKCHACEEIVSLQDKLLVCFGRITAGSGL
jgi:hypothetical protein